MVSDARVASALGDTERDGETKQGRAESRGRADTLDRMCLIRCLDQCAGQTSYLVPFPAPPPPPSICLVVRLCPSVKSAVPGSGPESRCEPPVAAELNGAERRSPI